MMKTRYLSQQEIQQMAEAALISYEFGCSWKRAFQAAAEFAADELGVKATRAQAATAVRIAQTDCGKASELGFRSLNYFKLRTQLTDYESV